MQIREAAERILFATSLKEKLAPAPARPDDSRPGSPLSTPDCPGRPTELALASPRHRAPFPSLAHLHDDAHRAALLHFLANHELLAAELMALALLRFPDAPPAYRAGLYRAMREEQAHTRMYLRRMADCGLSFGQLPVNGYFWHHIAPSPSPSDFVARLNLTFEQANLDFTRHYASLFQQAGDPATAAVLDHIYRDEISHVAHGLTWFRRWKDPALSDWQAYSQALHFPLHPSKAKGLAPFNPEARRRAGFDEDFIAHLAVSGQSRGRTPVVCLFNPNAEAHALHPTPQLAPAQLALALDLALLALAWARRDDAVLVPSLPSPTHLATLQQTGIELPEFVTLDQLHGRKLSGLAPWAWSPDASTLLAPLAPQVAPSLPLQWRQPIPSRWLSKLAGADLNQHLATGHIPTPVHDLPSALDIARQAPTIFKAAHSCAGRGQLRTTPATADLPATASWLARTLAACPTLTAEPLLDALLDFSAQYQLEPPAPPRLIGYTRLENTPRGQPLAIHVAPRFAHLLPDPIRHFLFRDADITTWFTRRIPDALAHLFPGYHGPLGIDAMVHRAPDGTLALCPIIEANVRMTMGRVALELHRRLSPDRHAQLRISPLPKAPTDGLPLNDPNTATRFLATWHTTP
jgi:uncharacterized ferritin-like protein (DUF455 family)